MGSILILGGGVCGLAAAAMLARDGHEVTLLERDPAELPPSTGAAWEGWERRGVPQFRLAHYLQPRGRQVLDEQLPGVTEALAAAGGLEFDPIAVLPPLIEDREPRAGDERFRTITARRTTIELVIGRAADEQPGLTLRRGVEAGSLLTSGSNGTAHVGGVRTTGGEELTADLVVDAMGRGSKLGALLREAGIEPGAEQAEDSGFLYYSRFYAGDGPMPAPYAPLLTAIGSFSVLTLPGDNGTWSVTLTTASGDRALKALRHEDTWDALLRACPAHAHWIDGEPLTGVVAMGGIIDRYREPVPAATGVVSLADACACTNPSLGRGISLGLVHAAALRGVVREQLGDPAALRDAWVQATEAEYGPWYRATLEIDRARLQEIEAICAGHEPDAPSDPAARVRAALFGAMGRDADVFRAGMEIVACLSLPEQVFTRPGLVERVLELGENAAVPPFGPPREQLLELVGAA